MTLILTYIAAVIVTLMGPIALLAADPRAWQFVAGVTGLVAGCCWLSRLAWRRWPDSEVFVLGLLVAAAIWGVSGWLGLAVFYV